MKFISNTYMYTFEFLSLFHYTDRNKVIYDRLPCQNTLLKTSVTILYILQKVVQVHLEYINIRVIKA